MCTTPPMRAWSPDLFPTLQIVPTDHSDGWTTGEVGGVIKILLWSLISLMGNMWTAGKDRNPSTPSQIPIML